LNLSPTEDHPSPPSKGFFIPWEERLRHPPPPPLTLWYFGTPPISAEALRILAGFPDLVQIEGVVTAPDRPRGRGLKVTPTPVALTAEELHLPLYKPERLGEIGELLRGRNPHLFFVFAYGKIFPPSLLQIPAVGPLNLHLSLLPRHRGPNPIPHTILAGDESAGMTLMGMEPELDAGPILSLRSFPLSPRDTAGDLITRISRELPSFLREGLERLINGALSPTPQDPSRATYAGKLDRNDRRIPWGEGVERVDRWVREFSPSPGAWSLLRDREIKILSGIPRQDLTFPPEVLPGTLITKGGRTAQLIAVTGDRCGYEILIVKPEGKKAMSAQEFLRGAHLRPGERLL